MGNSGRDIKRRIQSVKNTQQITKAMEMIAAVKLRKAQATVEKSRPYRHQLETSLSEALFAARKAGEDLPAIAKKTNEERPCLVVLTSDRGLVGGFNANILRQADEYIQKHKNTQVIVVGRKGRDYFRRQNSSVLADFVYLGDAPSFAQAKDISHVIQEFFLNDIVDRVDILYTNFVSTITHPVVKAQMLPLVELPTKSDSGVQALYLYEPSVAEVLAHMVPLYLDTVIFHAIQESNASEQASSMNAMRNASDNAVELIEELNLSFNRYRQSVITTEISEIVGGAEALG